MVWDENTKLSDSLARFDWLKLWQNTIHYCKQKTDLNNEGDGTSGYQNL